MTLQKPFRNPASCHCWLWALLPLLLAAALAIPLLYVDAFNGDEPDSIFSAGVLDSGPQSLLEVWNYIEEHHATQTQGWSILLFAWGRVVGWSELAIRALSLFFGLLTLAWVYRAGYDFLTPMAGHFAALLLSSSVFVIAYMIHARAFSLVALFTTLILWCYGRIILQPGPPGRGTQAGLLLGSIGLLYSHYLASLFLVALVLFHLFFVPKTRRWWRPIALSGLAFLFGGVQIPGLLGGLSFLSREELGSRVLTAPALISHFLRYITNGLADPSPPFSELLLLALPLGLVIVTLWRLRRGKGVSAIWLLFFTSAALLAIVIVINELFKVIAANRIRYLMPLWPLTALLVGAGLWRLARSFHRLVFVLLALWLIFGAWLTLATDFRYEAGYFFRRDKHPIYHVVRKLVPRSDLLVFDHTAADYHAGWVYDIKSLFSYKADPFQYVRPVHANHPYLWYIYLSKDHVGYVNLSLELGRVLCERVLDESGFTLERYALHLENCPERPVRLEFDSGIRLTAPTITISDGLLRLDAHFRSADATLLARYSLAVHVIDPRTGKRIAQGDVGVGLGTLVTVASEIDVSALPPGEYEVRVALYDWQTGERLSARDTETNEVGDMHTLHHFQRS